MVAHDENIGMMLDKLDALGIADDIIVLYSTDNGVHYNTWGDRKSNRTGGWRRADVTITGRCGNSGGKGVSTYSHTIGLLATPCSLEWYANSVPLNFPEPPSKISSR